jgi:hypothetical protein
MSAPAAPSAAGAAVSKPIGECRWRERVRVVGRIRALRVQPWEGGATTLEATLVDDTGGIMIAFLGRQQIGGIKLGAHLEAEGVVIESRGQLALLNPSYTLLPA